MNKRLIYTHYIFLTTKRSTFQKDLMGVLARDRQCMHIYIIIIIKVNLGYFQNVFKKYHLTILWIRVIIWKKAQTKKLFNVDVILNINHLNDLVTTDTYK